jgi:hypothetical protein
MDAHGGQTIAMGTDMQRLERTLDLRRYGELRQQILCEGLCVPTGRSRDGMPIVRPNPALKELARLRDRLGDGVVLSASTTGTLKLSA